jgi:hypothetical protein
MSADVGKLVLTVADAAAAAAELGAGAGAVDGDAAEDGVPVGDEAGPAAGEPLGADAGAGAAAGRAGTVSTAPTEEAVPLMGPDNPSGKKPPVPFWLPSTAMLTTCRPNVVISWHA